MQRYVFGIVLVLCLVRAAYSAPTRTQGCQATIAFHFRLVRDDLLSAQRMIARVYHPSNYYLIDIPSNLRSRFIKRSMQQYSNVIVRQVDRTVPNGISEVVSVLDAMAFFLDLEDTQKKTQQPHLHRLFDYFISLTEKELPLLTATYMRDALGSTLTLDPLPVFMRFSHRSHWASFSQNFNRLHYDASIMFSTNETALHEIMKSGWPHPHGSRRMFTIPRTQRQMVLSHAFVKLAVDSQLSKRVLISIAESANGVDHFFGALALADNGRVARLVRSTSLRCPDIVGMDRPLVFSSKPRYAVPEFRVSEILNYSTPCLFADPYAIRNVASVDGELHAHVLRMQRAQDSSSNPYLQAAIAKIDIHNKATGSG